MLEEGKEQRREGSSCREALALAGFLRNSSARWPSPRSSPVAPVHASPASDGLAHHAVDGFISSIWFFWFMWLSWFVSFKERNQLDTGNKSDRPKGLEVLDCAGSNRGG